ncbi:MAG: hypothetical protein U0V54_06635 [Saprospiraceae bacterium]|nr:hypothetical protein [Saprospiraceae bacterium]
MNKIAKTAITLSWILLLLTAGLHSLSFFSDPNPVNETEKQLVDLMQNYKSDMGAGFHRSMEDLLISVSACLTLLCLLGGLIILYLSKAGLEPRILKGVMSIHAVIFGIAFVVMLIFAFLPPIVCIGLIFFSTTTAALKLE